MDLLKRFINHRPHQRLITAQKRCAFGARILSWNTDYADFDDLPDFYF